MMKMMMKKRIGRDGNDVKRIGHDKKSLVFGRFRSCVVSSLFPESHSDPFHHLCGIHDHGLDKKTMKKMRKKRRRKFAMVVCLVFCSLFVAGRVC